MNLARLNIVNPTILSDVDLTSILSHENFTIQINDLLIASDVKVCSSSNIIKYIVKIPNIQNICKLIQLFPVIQNNTIIELRNEYASNCGFNYVPLCNCKITFDLTFCRNDILVNDQHVIVTENNKSISLNGTFLIIHSETILINNTRFFSSNKQPRLQPEQSQTISLNIITHSSKVTLPYLHQLQIQNLKKIKEFDENFGSQNIYWYILITILSTIVVVIILYLRCRQNQPVINTISTPGPNFDNEILFSKIMKNLQDRQQIRDEPV